ncbi:DUF3329 domain-containing protein [Tropicimonas sp. IMCC6043]|uniref:DUF3329 domain-containing protein n=1 Tax=Tropicimonas sp. IMCC6043 TaxID=2510645 RepID=UPI00101C1EE3|nr:DUF3329 domain-containing protein [Tropicimonas sp. IMCC6043]RYH09913.1 DUF3329 domain-containing protein [Tropicimonas sp. IMCC6043]
MKLIDTDHPFYAPLWRRAVIVALTLGWSAFEFVAGSPIWGVLTGALGVYCLYMLFITYDPKGGDGA